MQKVIRMAFAALFALFSLSLNLHPFFTVSAAPQSGYGRVLKDGVLLYRDTSFSESSALFSLVKSYYVYIPDINTAENYYRVEYQTTENGYVKLTDCFVKKTDLTIWNNPTPPYYPEISATLKSDTAIYPAPAISEDIVGYKFRNNQPLKLYGSIKNTSENSDYYFIMFYNPDVGWRNGYIPAANLDVTLPSPHSDPMPTPTPTPTPTPSDSSSAQPSASPTSENKDSLVQILLITAICIPALIIVYLMFRPAKKTGRNYKEYYDDDDG
jgi:hypothetical protein